MLMPLFADMGNKGPSDSDIQRDILQNSTALTQKIVTLTDGKVTDEKLDTFAYLVPANKIETAPEKIRLDMLKNATPITEKVMVLDESARTSHERTDTVAYKVSAEKFAIK